jgi:hypothetical protein
MPPKKTPLTVPPIPLDFKEAVSRLLRVKPDPKKKKRSGKTTARRVKP